MESAQLTCSEASVLLGLSTSTVKRLCDDGQLPSMRTPGGHRRIAKTAVLDWRNRSQHITGLQQDGESWQEPPSISELIDLLLENAADLACDRLERYRKKFGVQALIDHVVGPLMGEVGARWSAQKLAVYEEHLITDQIRQYLNILSDRIPQNSRSVKRAIGGAPEYDPSDLATKAIELCLRECGWNANSCGARLPARELAAAAIHFEASVVWVSYTHPIDALEIRQSNRLLRDLLPSPVRLLVGGSALRDDLRKQLHFDFAGDSMGHICNYVTRL